MNMLLFNKASIRGNPSHAGLTDCPTFVTNKIFCQKYAFMDSNIGFSELLKNRLRAPRGTRQSPTDPIYTPPTSKSSIPGKHYSHPYL